MKIKNTEIVYAYVKFKDIQGGKSRPVLTFQLPGRPQIAYKITTKYDSKPDYIRRAFYKIQRWQEAGLKKQSWIDTNFRISVSELEVEAVFGKLHYEDVVGLRKFLFDSQNGNRY